MSRHASAEDLASLDLGALKPRKAAKVQAHVSVCAQCTQLSREVSAVPTTLASVSYPAMPEHLSMRMDSVLAAESAQRVATAPASEAGRRDLPERSRRAHQPTGGWHLPWMSVVATRLAAAAGALVIVGVGGYEIAANVGGNQAGTAATSSGSAAAPRAQGGQLSFGPSVRYGEPTSNKTVPMVHSDTDFTSATLGTQALAAVRESRVRRTGPQATTGAVPSAHANSNASASGLPSTSQLASCLDGVAGNQTVLLVDQAKYEGKPATIIVTAQSSTRSGQVWAVGPACSASHPDVLQHVTLSRT